MEWPNFVEKLENGELIIKLKNFSLFPIKSGGLIPVPININVIDNQYEVVSQLIEQRLVGQPVSPWPVYISPLLLLCSAEPILPTALIEGGKSWCPVQSSMTVLKMYMRLCCIFESTKDISQSKDEILTFHTKIVEKICELFYGKIDGNLELKRLKSIHQSMSTRGSSVLFVPQDWKSFTDVFARYSYDWNIEYINAYEKQIMEFLQIPKEYQNLFLTSKTAVSESDVPDYLKQVLINQHKLYMRYRNELVPESVNLVGINSWILNFKGISCYESLYNMLIFYLFPDSE